MEEYTDNFDEIIPMLNEGKIILYPTDTIWGLGCDALNENSIRHLFEIKKRVPDKPFIILVSDLEMLKSYVKEIHPRVETLLAYHARPLTVIFKAKKKVPPLLKMDGKAAIRIIKDDRIAEFIRQFGRPIVTTSANISNEPFPQNFDEISDAVKSQVDYIFNYKREEKEPGMPSVIAAYSKTGKLRFLR